MNMFTRDGEASTATFFVHNQILLNVFNISPIVNELLVFLWREVLTDKSLRCSTPYIGVIWQLLYISSFHCTALHDIFRFQP
jgi:hypothetical protein